MAEVLEVGVQVVLRDADAECMVDMIAAGASVRGEAGASCVGGDGGMMSGEGVRVRGSRMVDMIVAGATPRGEAGGEGVLERRVDIAVAGEEAEMVVLEMAAVEAVWLPREEEACEWMVESSVPCIAVLGEEV